jgi:RNA polymerase sigma factor (sigma-70 family)
VVTWIEPPEQTSVEVGDRLRDGDPSALEELYRRDAGWVFAIALRALRSHHDAEDVCQQVFVDVWRGRTGYDPRRGTPDAWIAGITHRRVLDRLRLRTRQARADGAAGPERVGTDTATEVVAGLAVETELAALPPDQQEVVRLAVVEQATHSEIAARTGLPLGTVKSHARRGLARLRRRWEAADEPPDA